MKAAQITEYSKEFHIAINEIAMPEIKDHELLKVMHKVRLWLLLNK